jgi:putative SOS response-associated peptidase YedK
LHYSGGRIFDWEKKGKEKRPFYIRQQNKKPMAFAGLWERWHDEEAEQDIESCTIITTGANEVVGRLHDRMPVILEPEVFDLWLDPGEQRVDRLKELLGPAGSEALTMYPVSNYVNKATNEGEKCVEPVKDEG